MPNGITIGSVVLQGSFPLRVDSYRQTDYVTASAAIGRIYVHLRIIAGNGISGITLPNLNGFRQNVECSLSEGPRDIGLSHNRIWGDIAPEIAQNG